MINKVKLCKDCNLWLKPHPILPNQNGYCSEPSYAKINICNGQVHYIRADKARQDETLCGKNATNSQEIQPEVQKPWYTAFIAKLFGG